LAHFPPPEVVNYITANGAPEGQHDYSADDDGGNAYLRIALARG